MLRSVTAMTQSTVSGQSQVLSDHIFHVSDKPDLNVDFEDLNKPLEFCVLFITPNIAQKETVSLTIKKQKDRKYVIYIYLMSTVVPA